MTEEPQTTKRSVTPDWLVHGVLTKLGDAFDRLLGRDWKPSSSLATSELIERLKGLLDAEARDVDGRKFVPHNIKLKMQWDKFSTDSEEGLRKLETELLAATVDHINDRRYFTKFPISLEVKPDYFTDGVKLFVSFDEADEEGEAAINVTMPGGRIAVPQKLPAPEARTHTIIFRFALNGRPFSKELRFEVGRRFSVGRTKENDFMIDDPSVSKVHASLLLNRKGKFVVADTGSTNGTFVDGQRIPYGKAVEFGNGTDMKFGTVGVSVEVLEKPRIEAEDDAPGTETYTVGEFEFTKRTEQLPELPEDASNPALIESRRLTEPIQNLRSSLENEKGKIG